MRDDMFENIPSPFDPSWYKEAFDSFISTDDQKINQELILNEGFVLPDSDGSKSSIFRNDAINNNSFNEKMVRESLLDIYLNSSHKLIASNHDNVNYFQWNGHIRDFEIDETTKMVELRIPWNIFITAKERLLYKTSPFYTKWTKDSEIANNWKIFKWYLMVFLNKRIYSGYEIKILEQEVLIRFPYVADFINKNVPIYIYKFDTNFQYRALLSKELCKNQWNWNMPVSYITDKNILNHPKIMVAFNKIQDPSIREDGNTHVEILGDNLEFLDVKDGFIDLTKISKYNRILLESELKEYTSMTIVVPKFFQEYPILLPVDPIYHPRVNDIRSVISFRSEEMQNVKSSIDNDSETRQVYIDYTGNMDHPYEGWHQLIRPLVLTDAFENPEIEPYDGIIDDMKNLRDLTVEAADLIEEFRFYLRDEEFTEEKFLEYLDKILDIMKSVYDTHNAFLVMKSIDKNSEYEKIYNDDFLPAMEEIKKDKIEHYLFHSITYNDDDFWKLTSPLIWIPRNLADRFYVVSIIKDMRNRTLWNKLSDHIGKNRFQRPIDERDFWTFEYDPGKRVWRPFPLTIDRKFPDVYLMKDPNEEIPSLNRIFKAFFFYSDNMNVRNEESDIIKPTPTWDEDVITYHYEPAATYRDIFMEKFYWMAIKSLYNGTLISQTRWETLEYIINNNSYIRFSELFLRTMDPYFKLGLATYLKSSNYEFPFDDAIAKLEEAMNLEWNDFKKITNFEIYLNKSWIPSYFDHVFKIMKDWNYDNKLLRRPDKTFDMRRLQDSLIGVSSNTVDILNQTIENLQWILSKLKVHTYHLDIPLLNDLLEEIQKVYNVLKIKVLDFISNIDMDIYSLDDLNFIILQITGYNSAIEDLMRLFEAAEHDVDIHNIYESKREILKQIQEILESAKFEINQTLSILDLFGIKEFMDVTNNLETYLNARKINLNDNSLINQINRFDDPWTMNVKEKRNLLFQSTAMMYGSYDPNKIYTDEEIHAFYDLIQEVKNNLIDFRQVVNDFWTNKKLKVDQFVLDRLDQGETIIEGFVINFGEYVDNFDKLKALIDSARYLLHLFYDDRIDYDEIQLRETILEELDNIIKSVSNITGNNVRTNAETALQNARLNIVQWLNFIEFEETIFLGLLDIVERPNAVLGVMDNSTLVLEDIVNFIRYTTHEFTPDLKLPTYSDVYSINTVEIDNKGFWHDVGDLVYIPELGIYRIISIDGELARAKEIEETSYRKTTFRDPLSQTIPYHTLTDGVGMGLTIKAISSNHILIINDEVILRIINRLNDILRMIQKFTYVYNSKNNVEYQRYLEIIMDIKNNWDKIFNQYNEHMTYQIKSQMNIIINTMISLIEPSQSFINKRSVIDLDIIGEKFEEIIDETYKYMEFIGEINETYYYYDTPVREVFNKYMEFIVNWTTSNTIEEVVNLFDNSITAVNSYKETILNSKPTSDELTHVKGLILDFIALINSTKVNVQELPQSTLEIQNIINDLNSYINSLPNTLHKDEWYRITDVKTANPGYGYKIGDIIKIHTDAEEELFFQITAVDNDFVTGIQPLINYALPYFVFGLYDTETCTGSGKMLTIDLFYSKIEITDSTLVSDENSYIKPVKKFNDLDLFMFKFENIHDLPIRYEVFIAGKPIQNFYSRHETVEDPLHPKKIDVIYVNANEVDNLQNASIYIPEEQYFIYKIDEINIKDPGTGYANNQEIFVDADQYVLRLKVAKLLYEPYKGIEKVSVASGKLTSKTLTGIALDAHIIDDTLNNIDDEYHVSEYDKIPKDGINKPATRSYSQSDYEYTSVRYDELDIDNRNETFMYPDVNIEDGTEGDPDSHMYLGSRIDNSQHPMVDPRRWNGIMNIEPPTDSFIPDNRRLPPGLPVKGEYQLFDRIFIHNTPNEIINGDLEVATYADLPKHVEEWPEAMVDKSVIVLADETYENHRMRYIIRSCTIRGFLVYHIPEKVDITWNHVNVDWMNADYYPDIPGLKQQYPDASWRTAKSYVDILSEIADKRYERQNIPTIVNHSSYIHNLIIDDLSVFNWTTKTWEDLHDTNRWRLDVRDDPDNKDWGFTLTFLKTGEFKYDMKFYWNKIPSTQLKNAELKRNAIMDIITTIIGEVNISPITLETNTNRNIMIRKLFPYYQKESFVVGKDEEGISLGNEMNFKLAPYIHFKNEIHLEDITVYNKTTQKFEDILDTSKFEVRFKDSKTSNRGKETQSKIVNALISTSGSGFYSGTVFAWNEQYGICVFGEVVVDNIVDGHVVSFVPLHCPKYPDEDIVLEFQIFQSEEQTEAQQCIAILEFVISKVEVFGDGYIHNVINKLAPITEEFQIIVRDTLTDKFEYDIIIDKSPFIYDFFHQNWVMSPRIHIHNKNIPTDRIYIESDKGRFPLVNPSTRLPSISAKKTEDGTDIMFYNLYRRWEHLKVKVSPYPIRSVYTQRDIPVNGYIDLTGKLNKPLNKKYFEFWMNGRLLSDEVTIITPTKLFLHGLKSLRNFEIIEINRDPNEYFSNSFMEKKETELGRPYITWNYETYLDYALMSKLPRDNYTSEEQTYLLSPVWPQVSRDHPFFKDYPLNVDEEDDIMSRIMIPSDLPIEALDGDEGYLYQFMIVDLPTLEDTQIAGQHMAWWQFGWRPITNEQIVDMLNDEWADEISNNKYIKPHTVISPEDYHGTVARLYDEYGIQVDNLNSSVYSVADFDILMLNSIKKTARIVHTTPMYDLN